MRIISSALLNTCKLQTLLILLDLSLYFMSGQDLTVAAKDDYPNKGGKGKWELGFQEFNPQSLSHIVLAQEQILVSSNVDVGGQVLECCREISETKPKCE